MDAKLVKAFAHPGPDAGLRNAKQLAAQLDKKYPSAAASLREGLEEMFTVARLGIDGRLAKTLTTSNPVESMISITGATNRNVTQWRDGQWCCAGPPPECSTPNDPSAGSRATNRYPNWSTPCVDTPTPKPPATPNLSVPPPRVHYGSSPKFHATREYALQFEGGCVMT